MVVVKKMPWREIRHGIFICTDVNTYVHSRDARQCVFMGVMLFQCEFFTYHVAVCYYSDCVDARNDS